MTLSLSLVTFCRPNSLFTFHSLQHHVHIHHRRDYDEQKAVAVVMHHYQGCQLHAKRFSTQKYLRGLDNQCPSGDYINFLTPFRAAYNQVNMVSHAPRSFAIR